MTTFLRMWIAGVLPLVALVLTPAGVLGQQENFGKNKVQYTRFSWSFIQTDHFDIYFSQGGYPVAEFAAVAAESAYASISKSFRYQLNNRIPIILYTSHNAFQQTNVVNDYLEEGIGGVTELFKNRVVLPFDGDYKQFRHVLHHELVHGVINDMFYGGSIQSIITNNITLQLPLWMNEGLCEFQALQWETNSDMFLRDATVNENLPPINQLYGYWAYRGGQSVWWYIANKYGEQKVGEILNRIKSVRSVEMGFRASIGLSLEELSERWQREMKVLYWPDVAKREEPTDYARRLTDHKKDGGFYNTSPSISPQGDKVAFISNRDDFFSVYIMNALDGSRVYRLVAGEQTEDLEELHLLTPAIAWSPEGRRIALAAKAGSEDAIIVIDVNTGSQERITFGLQGVFSVDWSPTGDRLAFVGNDGRQSDIYVYDMTEKKLENITNDRFSDEWPAWSADGTVVFYGSDRGALDGTDSLDVTAVKASSKDLYMFSLTTRTAERLNDWPGSDESSPVPSPDGKKLLFVSDRNGINNIYEIEIASRNTRPVTNSISGVYQLSLSRDGSKLVFTSLHRSGYDIFLMRSPFDRDAKLTELEPTEFIKRRLAGSEVLFGPDSLSVAQAAPAEPAKNDTAQQLYGENIQIDFSNYVFQNAPEESVPKDSLLAQMPRIEGNLDEEGKFRVNKYKLNFSPDIVYGNAGYDTFYGVTGSTIMAFSDLLGDHQIILATNLLLDLKNSDYAVQYYYLPERVDFGVGGFHSARFIIVNDIFGGSLYRFRTYGVSLSGSYPFDRFRRLEFGAVWLNVSKENLDNPLVPAEQRTLLVPQLSYTYDTSLWGFISPMTGTRYRIDLFGTPKLGLKGLSFVNVTFDYRTYLRLGRMYSFAIRLAGGGSYGENPQKFIIGGVDNWINRQFEGGYIPLQNAEDFIFLQTGVPLRGYNYNTAIGSSYGLLNLEFRYPLFAFLQAGPVPVGQSLGGVVFFDAGSAWNNAKDIRFFRVNEEGRTVTRDLYMGMGTGARIYLLAFLLKLDIAWAWNYDSFSSPKYYFSLGFDW